MNTHSFKDGSSDTSAFGVSKGFSDIQMIKPRSLQGKKVIKQSSDTVNISAVYFDGLDIMIT